VNVALAVFAGVAVAGAVLAVSTRDVRATVLGLLVVFLAAPLIASPWPDPPAILARVAGALLAARLLTIGLRGEEATVGTRIGWPTEALAGAAGAVIGYGSHGLGAVALGPAEAQAAGFGLVAVAIAPMFTGRDVLRLGVGSVLLVMGAVLIRVGLDAPLGDGEQLVISLLMIGLGGALGVIAAAARAAGGLELANVQPGRRGPRPPDAHRAEPPAPGRPASLSPPASVPPPASSPPPSSPPPSSPPPLSPPPASRPPRTKRPAGPPRPRRPALPPTPDKATDES
jgi:hypothetical protein